MALPADPPRSWWEREAAETLAVAIDATGHRYDALVVDEGQDFTASWLAALQLLLSSDDAPICIFADSLQTLFDRDWGVPPEWPIFELDINCRNTRKIAARVSALVGQDIPTLGAEGPKPQYVTVRDEADLLATLPDIVDGLLTDEDFDPEACVVLVRPSTLADRIRNMTTETTSFVPFGKHGVGVESIGRFKGLESPVVFLSLHGVDLSTEIGRALGYVGMSRARALLFVLGTKEQRETLAWGIAGG
jgi:superfamily I DNA/RNA helicase